MRYEPSRLCEAPGTWTVPSLARFTLVEPPSTALGWRACEARQQPSARPRRRLFRQGTSALSSAAHPRRLAYRRGVGMRENVANVLGGPARSRTASSSDLESDRLPQPLTLEFFSCFFRRPLRRSNPSHRRDKPAATPVASVGISLPSANRTRVPSLGGSVPTFGEEGSTTVQHLVALPLLAVGSFTLVATAPAFGVSAVGSMRNGSPEFSGILFSMTLAAENLALGEFRLAAPF